MLNKYFRLRRLGILFALWVGALALVGCEIEEAARATAVPTTATTPLAVASETATATPAPLGTATPSLTPSPATATVTATTPPATVTPSATPVLGATAPWLLWLNSEYENENSGVAAGYYVSNRDGSAMTPIDSISPNETVRYFGDNPTPAIEILHGPYLVTVERASAEMGNPLWYQPTTLTVRELPFAQKVVETFLLSESAQAIIAEDETKAILFTMREMVWSADSRYLAFASARDDTTSDIYLVDTQAGTIRRAVDGPFETFPIALSPDGKWLVYGSAETLYIECDCPDTIWLYNVEEHSTRYLYDSGRFRESVVGWLDGEWVITVTNAFEANDYNPRKINLFTGEVVSLDDGSFGVYAYDPNGFLLINRTPTMHTPDGFDTTLFTSIDVRSGTRTDFHIPSDGSQLVWIGGDIGLFTTHDRVNRYLFDHTGAIRYTFPYGDFHGHPQLAPNGQWLLVDTSEGWDIYHVDGTLLADLNLPGQPQWLPENELLVNHDFGWAIHHPVLANGTPDGREWIGIPLRGEVQVMDSVWQINGLP